MRYKREVAAMIYSLLFWLLFFWAVTLGNLTATAIVVAPAFAVFVATIILLFVNKENSPKAKSKRKKNYILNDRKHRVYGFFYFNVFRIEVSFGRLSIIYFSIEPTGIWSFDVRELPDTDIIEISQFGWGGW